MVGGFRVCGEGSWVLGMFLGDACFDGVFAETQRVYIHYHDGIRFQQTIQNSSFGVLVPE